MLSDEDHMRVLPCVRSITRLCPPMMLCFTDERAERRATNQIMRRTFLFQFLNRTSDTNAR